LIVLLTELAAFRQPLPNAWPPEGGLPKLFIFFSALTLFQLSNANYELFSHHAAL
jgi:hypothetical protein